MELVTLNDEAPPLEEESTSDYDPAFPGSTKDAPYGFKPDGAPYKRRPNKSGTRESGVKRTPASESAARAAAGLLAQLNTILVMVLGTPMPQTAEQLEKGNKSFEEMAYQSLLSDPVLCRKILAAGKTSGTAGLVMAYAVLGLSVGPTAVEEYRSRRAARLE